MTENVPDNSIYRILDAAINRASEGLRVVEDFLRMVIADAHLSRQLKELRHELTDAVAGIESEQRMAARDSERDVGREIQTAAEYQRGEAGTSSQSTSLVQANLARVQQALRSIEEFSKTIDAEVAKQVEQLRYRTYTIEKAILTTVLSLKHLADADLCVLIEGPSEQDAGEFAERVQQLARAKVGLLQLRDKRLSDRQLIVAGKTIAKLVRGTETRFIMNDRTDLAFASGADGVHLGQDDLAVADARRILGATKLIGVSTHSIEQARQAVLDGANYIGVGPVFPSTTKHFETHVGLELLQQVAGEVQLPAFAIGGIHLENLLQVVDAGISRVAVSGAVANAADPFASAVSLREVLKAKPSWKS